MSDLHMDSPVQMLLPTHDPLSHNTGDRYGHMNSVRHALMSDAQYPSGHRTGVSSVQWSFLQSLGVYVSFSSVPFTATHSPVTQRWGSDSGQPSELGQSSRVGTHWLFQQRTGFSNPEERSFFLPSVQMFFRMEQREKCSAHFPSGHLGVTPVRDDIQHGLVERADGLFFAGAGVTQIEAHSIVPAVAATLCVLAGAGVARGALGGGDDAAVVVAAVGRDGGAGVDHVALRG